MYGAGKVEYYATLPVNEVDKSKEKPKQVRWKMLLFHRYKYGIMQL